MDHEHPTKLDRLMHAVAEHHRLRAAERFELQGVSVLVESNSAPLIAALRDHYADHLSDRSAPHRVGAIQPCARFVLIEAGEPDLGLTYRRWSGRRHEYAEVAGGRVLREPVSRLQFLLGPDLALAVGGCLQASRRVVELIDERVKKASVSERLLARAGRVYRA